MHIDKINDHIISSIFHVDREYDDDDEPWPIVIEGLDGHTCVGRAARCCCCCCCAHVPPLLVVLLPLRLYYCTTNSLSSPLRYAVLFSNCIGMVWNVFLSYTANGGGKTVEDEKKKE